MPDERLLKALAEQLKAPLLQIARSAELQARAADIHRLPHIQYVAETALSYIDAFLLSVDRQASELLALEPVSVSSILNDTAHQLEQFAKDHNCDVEVHLSGKYGPVMAHNESLQSALMLLGYSLIEAQTPQDKRHQVVLAAHKSSRGLVTGVFDNQAGLSTDVFRRGRALYGTVRQPLPAVSGGAGAGVFIADALLRSMSAPLRVARHNSLTGLAATFHASSQLQLVP
jgi:hypothetical protein